MRWADIEVPNRHAAMDARWRSACYPRSTFCLLSDRASTRDDRITRSCFRSCSTYLSCSQAGFCAYTHCAIADRTEPTFELLRYHLGGDRPSQTAHLARSPARIHGIRVRWPSTEGWYFTLWLPGRRNGRINASHLSYASELNNQCQAAVKVHGVFPSCCG